MVWMTKLSVILMNRLLVVLTTRLSMMLMTRLALSSLAQSFDVSMHGHMIIFSTLCTFH